MGTIAAPPWKTTILIDHLLPHRLTAIAMDGSGHDFARSAQAINVARPATETEILLERSG